MLLPDERINLQHSSGQVKRSAAYRGLLTLRDIHDSFRHMLSVLTQPCAISGGDKGAKTLQAWIIRGARLKVGENLPQS